MSTATWFWATKVTVTPLVADQPPQLVDPGPQEWSTGVFKSLRISNVGGPVATWSADWLPPGISITSEDTDHCIISGTPTGLTVPILQDPGNQTWEEGVAKTVTVRNVGGPVQDWKVDVLPPGFGIDEDDTTPFELSIKNLDQEPLKPLNTKYYDEFLDAQHGIGAYQGHGPWTLDRWACVEALPPGQSLELECGVNINQWVGYYDYARCMMDGYHWKLFNGVDDQRFISYADAAANIYEYYYNDAAPAPAGNHVFTAGPQSLYDHDPATYQYMMDRIKILIDDSGFGESGDPDIYPKNREYNTRPAAYALLGYLDYLYDKPGDPYWTTSNYPLWRRNLLARLYQATDEIRYYAEDDFIEVQKTNNFYTVYDNPNYNESYAFTFFLDVEAAFRVLFQDVNGDYDRDLLLSRLETALVYDHSIRFNGHPYRVDRNFEWCSDMTLGNYIPDSYGESEGKPYYCFRDLYAVYPSKDFWASWRLASWGWLYAATGNRRYIEIGDEYWNWTWAGYQMWPYLGNPGKEHTQGLRYVSDYVRIRGGLDFKTQFSNASGMALPAPVLPHRKLPEITQPAAIPVTVGSSMTPVQLAATNSPTAWTANDLPPGLSVDENGRVVGTPDPAKATSKSTVRARNDDGCGLRTKLEFTVTPRPFSFANYGMLAVWDFTDTSTMWQDEAGTIPADTPGQTVARVDDQSGNGYNLLQPVAAARPQVVSVPEGGVGLSWDGVDDRLTATFPSTTQPNGIFCVGEAANNGDYFFDGTTSANRHAFYRSGVSQNWAINGGAAWAGMTSDAALHVFYIYFEDLQAAVIVDGGTTQLSRGKVTGSHPITGIHVGSSFSSDYGQLILRHFAIHDGKLSNGEVDEIGGHYATAQSLTWTPCVSQLPPDLVKIPVINDPGELTGDVGVAFSHQLWGTYEPGSWAASSLPTGLSLDSSTGLISGTPTTEQQVIASVTAANKAGTSLAQNVTITIGTPTGNPPVINDPGPQSNVQGFYHYLQLTASNSPTSWSAVGLPTGLTINTSTGLISGVTTVQQSVTATVTASNADGDSPGQQIDYTISQGVTWGDYSNLHGRYDLSNLDSLWEDDAGTTPASLGSLVGRADDLTGTEHVQGFTTTRPTVSADGSRFTVAFDGSATERLYSSTGVGQAQPNDIFVVLNPSSTQQSIATPFDSQQISGSQCKVQMVGGSYFMNAGVSLQGPVYAADTPQILLCRFDGAASYLYVDGGTPTVGDAGANASTGCTLGANLGRAANNHYTGTISHYIRNNGVLSLTEINEIGNALASYYGTTWTDVTQPVPVVDDPGAQVGTVGTPFSLQMTASNSPTSWRATSLPDGLTIDNAGLISGTPTTEETPTATVYASNAGGESAGQSVPFTINPAAPPFDWNDYPNIERRYDFTDLSSMYQDNNKILPVTQAGEPVYAVESQQGSPTLFDAIATNLTDARPTVVVVADGNGFALEHDGVNNAMAGTGSDVTPQPVDYFIVCELLDAPSAAQEIICDGVGARHFVLQQSNGFYGLFAGGTGVVVTPVTGNSDLNVYVARMDGTSSGFWINGGGNLFTGNPGSGGGQSIAFARNSSNTRRCRVRYRYAVKHAGALTETELNEIGGELAGQFGITWTPLTLAAALQARVSTSIGSQPQIVASDWSLVNQWDNVTHSIGISFNENSYFTAPESGTYQFNSTIKLDPQQFEFGWAVRRDGQVFYPEETVQMPAVGAEIIMPTKECELLQGDDVGILVRNGGGVEALNLLSSSSISAIEVT